MEEWIGLKEAWVTWSGVDRGALQVIASLIALIVIAAVIRRPLSSVLPWFLVVILAVGYEAIGGYSDGRLEDWEFAGSIRDLPLVMALPTLLLALPRFSPRLFEAPGRTVPRSMEPDTPPARDVILDAEFEEIP